jgi:hypothetical protein
MARQTHGNISEIRQQTVLTYQAGCKDGTSFELFRMCLGRMECKVPPVLTKVLCCLFPTLHTNTRIVQGDQKSLCT